MSAFIYNRTISIARRDVATAANAPGLADEYEGITGEAGETVVLTGLKASIQFKAFARGTGVELPGDVQRSIWDIYLPAKAAPLGAVRTRDTVIDDLGNRYVVTAPQWGPLGHRLRCELLEA